MERLEKIDFGVYENRYITLKKQTFRDVKVPKGFIFDGVTVKAPFTLIFSNKDLRLGIRASCFHDYCCQYKEKFARKDASKILIDLWRENGLGKGRFSLWKPYVVYLFVELYQTLKGWK